MSTTPSVNLPMLRHMLLGAKSSLLGESTIGPKPKLHQLMVHRAMEKTVWGAITQVPGEGEFIQNMQSQLPTHAQLEGKAPKDSLS